MGMFDILVLSLALAGPLAQPATHETIAPELLSDRRPAVRLTVAPITWSTTPRSRTDWQTLIDTAWGPGVSTAEKLVVFDTWWDDVDARFACFHDIVDDWADLRNQYRDEIAAGVSAGRFAGILGRFTLALQESHSVAYDTNVTDTAPTHGVPLLLTSSTMRPQYLGAAVTGLENGTGLVYRVAADNPLGLRPGDIILGYEGRPWIELRDELLAAELPIAGLRGSSPAASDQLWASAVGNNWHLFDTMDVLRHDTGAVEHLDTHVVDGYVTSILSTDQLPVGVPMPDIIAGQFVTWGVIARHGLQVGYVYVTQWTDDAGTLFDQAITELLSQHDLDGLIIDFRYNLGGNMALSNAGLGKLFTTMTPTIDWNRRANASEHLLLQSLGIWLNYVVPATPGWGFTRPIAVLTGPACVSSGDQVAYRLTFHPTARVFGRGTACAFNSPEYFASGSFHWANAPYESSPVAQPDLYLTHVGFAVDVPVWLTPDDVAQGRDTVAEAAADWIAEAVGVAVDDAPAIPTVARIEGVSPNPFNPRTTIVFTLTQPGAACLVISDVGGHQVRRLDVTGLGPGTHRVDWDGCGDNGHPVGSGAYVVQIRTSAGRDCRLVTLVR